MDATTSREWLQKNQKSPLACQQSDELGTVCCHYWSGPDPELPPDGHLSFVLPREVYRELRSDEFGVGTKTYSSREESLRDLEEAFDRAVEKGWVPT